MSKTDVTRFFKNAQAMAFKHSPEILTGIGIAGMITTTILAVKATPKAIRLLEEAKKEKEEDLTPVETISAAWKPFIPAIVIGSVSVACLVGASSVNARRNAALYSAYKLSETALSEYKSKVVETIGEEKARVVQNKVAQEKLEKNPVSKSTVIVTDGDVLCYDALSGRYFKSSVDCINKAVNELNRTMMNDMYVSLNDFYDEIGLSHINLGDELGWNMDNGLIDLDLTDAQVTDDGRPCLVVDYLVAPKYGFSRLV